MGGISDLQAAVDQDKHGSGNHPVGHIIPILSGKVFKMKIHQHVTRPSIYSSIEQCHTELPFHLLLVVVVVVSSVFS